MPQQLTMQPMPRLFIALVLLAFTATAAWSSDPPVSSDQVAEILRERLESAGLPAEMVVNQEPVLASNSLPEFYLQRFYVPAWSDGSKVRDVAFAFLEFLQSVDEEGLDPRHYHFLSLEESLMELSLGTPDANRLAEFDLLMTDAFLVLATHLKNGRINPVTIDPEWHASMNGFDPLPLLRRVLEQGDLPGTLAKLLPSAAEYQGLREALCRYRRIAEHGGWPQVPDGEALSLGMHSTRVPILRDRLMLSGDYPIETSLYQNDLYDARLEDAVRSYQKRNGLTPDGAVGKATLQALNIPVTVRVRQIEVNLERWRWLPRDLGERHVLINIPAFELVLVDNGKRVIAMKVVVGKTYRRTPVFTGLMTYLVLNPYWNVPRRIAVDDLAPQMRKDPGYLSRLNIKIFSGWGSDAREIVPAAIDWDLVSRSNFPYHLRQDPGEQNALGHIKFMLPNPYNVYLHDTPSRELFLKEKRTFSSGCIRLEKALDLAVYLLQGTKLGEMKALEAAIGKGKTVSVRLPRPLPVHLLYWTAWASAEGQASFRADIYGRDQRLQYALASGP